MSHIIAGRPGALPFGYVPRETATITANTPASAVDREARAQTISTAARADRGCAVIPRPLFPRLAMAILLALLAAAALAADCSDSGDDQPDDSGEEQIA